ncbi:uncharacterized protein LOC135714816 [Ochlerotatus camptorhynchus]|uniref:uncharacterized protein LOC135714816 n=1 Tax=Ochlerotatus camptorhynchus TaxID=644619 RepID=UPI0031E3BDA5
MPHTNINLDLFLELVNFCVGSSYFVYDGKYYEQVFGTAMGNPLSPIVVDLIMESLLDTTMRKLNFKPPFIRKYVDDLITAIPLEKLQHILDVFNSYDVHIQFTHELEVNNKLPFLDMLLVRQDNQRIKTEWYMKPIASGRFLDFLSYHPMSMKLNVAKNFISRVYRLSTNQSDEEKANIIDNQLRLNHYPAHLRHRLINRMTEHRQSPSITSADEDQQQQTPPVRQDTAPSEQSTGSNQQHLEHTYRSMQD